MTAPTVLEVVAEGGAMVAGLRVGNRLERCLAERLDRPGQTGAVLAARVVRRSPGGGGRPLVLADLGDGRPVPLSGSGVERLAAGDACVVQVTAEARAEKTAEAGLDIALAGRWLIHRPRGRGISASPRLDEAAAAHGRAALQGTRPAGGWVLRRAAEAATADDIAAEATELAGTWRRAGERTKAGAPGTVGLAAPPPEARLLTDHPAIAEICVGTAELARTVERRLAGWGAPRPAIRVEDVALAEELPSLLAPDMPFGDGGRLWIEPVRSLVAVDVDAGPMRDPLAANLLAVEALARALRLRNIGGLVVVDLLKLARAAERKQVLARLGQAVEDDPEGVRIGTLTPLGLVDLARRRRGPRLDEVLAPDG